jgi:hypothetical protein
MLETWSGSSKRKPANSRRDATVSYDRRGARYSLATAMASATIVMVNATIAMSRPGYLVR